MTRNQLAQRMRRYGIWSTACQMAWFYGCLGIGLFVIWCLESSLGDRHRDWWAPASVILPFVIGFGGVFIVGRLLSLAAGFVCPYCHHVVSAKRKEPLRGPEDFLCTGKCNCCDHQVLTFDWYDELNPPATTDMPRH